ncbi:MAG TPA: hypothetical protein DIW31_05025 [Bacteroidales bacterium]|nr:hypothetical protein [Bacteroidales bacterium]
MSFLSISGIAQNFIGQHKEEIRKNIKQAYPGFNFDKEVVNGKKSFLKYVNTFEEQTILFILDEKGNCTSMARMYNSWLLSQVKRDLDSKYKSKDSLTWLDSSNGKDFEIVLKKGKWFITVITRPKK